MHIELFGKLRNGSVPLDGIKRTLALKAGVWFRRARLDMVSPDSQVTACSPPGRNSTYRHLQISGTVSLSEKLDDTYKKGEEVHEILLQAKGARWVIVGIAGAAGLTSGVVAKLLPWSTVWPK